MEQQEAVPGQWFTIRRNTTYGPHTWEEVVDLARTGLLTQDDQVLGPGFSGFERADNIPEMEGQFGIAIPQPEKYRFTPSEKKTQPGYEEGLSPPRKRRRFRITGCLVIDIMMMTIVVIVTCLIVTAGGVYLFYPGAEDLLGELQQAASEFTQDLPAGIPQLLPGKPLPEPDLLGTLTVETSGGLFDNGEVGIMVVENAVAETTQFQVYRLENQDVLEEGEFYRSDYYLLEGPIALVQGDVYVSLPFPETAQTIPAEYQAVETVVSVFKDDPAYVRDTGFALSHTALDTQVDWDAGRVVATIPAAALSLTGTSRPAGLASSSSRRGSQQAPLLDQRVAVSVSYGAVYHYYTSEHFQVAVRDHPGIDTSGEAASDLLKMLEYQRTQLEGEFGYDFSGITQTTVYLDNFVTLRSTWNHLVYGEEPPEKWGMQTPSSLDENASTMSFNKRYFYDHEVFQMVQRELQSTAGHELFHVVQFTYDPRYAYFKAKDPLPSLWFDEAAAVWYESYAIDPENGSYLSPVAAAYTEFIHTPLLTPPQEADKAQNHGYGASIFLRYLTNQHGKELVRSTYEHYAAGPYSGLVSEAFSDALGDLDSSPGLEWPSFLEAYYTQPGSIIPGLAGPAEEHAAVLGVSVDSSGETRIAFQPNASLAAYQPVVEEGILEQGTLPSLQVTIPLQDLTADSLNITMDSSSDTQALFAFPGTMLVEVIAPEGSGVLVYGRQQRGAPTTTVAGAPWNYLSSEDPNSQTGAQLAVNFDLSGSADSYANLLLIPFNAHFSSYTSQPQSHPITLNLTYVTEAPTPPRTGEITCPAAVHINCVMSDASFDMPMTLTFHPDGGALYGSVSGQTVCPSITGSPEDPVPTDFEITSDYTIQVYGHYAGGKDGLVSGEADIVEEYYWPITEEMVERPMLVVLDGHLSPDCTGEGTMGKVKWYAP